MGVVIVIIGTLLVSGVLTLFSTVYIGGAPLFAAPLGALLVIATWICHDLIFWAGRSNSIVRVLFTWASTGRMKDKLREFGVLITMLQLWSTVSVAPALLCWLIGCHFSDFLPPLSFGQCFGACFFMEAFFSLVFDCPAGFVGVWRRIRGEPTKY